MNCRRRCPAFIALSFAVVGATSAAYAQGTHAEVEIPVGTSRQAWYGELHLHTNYSLDAYMMGTDIDPGEAYRFARGESVRGYRRTSPPLDFIAVTDHAEWMGVANTLEDADSALSRSRLGEEVRSGKTKLAALRNLGNWPNKPIAPPGVDPAAIANDSWQRTIAAANRYYEPGKFTTFIAYEWTVNFNSGQSYLHRNVIFRGGAAPRPFSAIDSDKPEDLWRFLESIRLQGYEALAIPHSSNFSDGVAFDWSGSDGRAIDQAYAQQRATNEPLVEISQTKGTSETHPILSPNDEFADFELMSIVADGPRRKEGSYVRDALGRGLVLAVGAGGINPFKYGFVGASDFHTGLSESAENGFAGFGGVWGPIDMSKDASEPERRLAQRTGVDISDVSKLMKFTEESSSGGLTGVWAESNSRESIYDAFRRKETFATSGTRLKCRFFGSWAFGNGLFETPDWVQIAYAQGVPMGSDLPSGSNRKPPVFALWAIKDPEGANLDRLQVVKVSLKDGKSVEMVYDVVLSDGRKLDPKTGKIPWVGNTVDVEKSTYTNTIGDVSLSGLWRDPNFDPDASAVYYLRVLEIPTPRWSTLVAARMGRMRPKSVTIQERGWSSPIWYTPPAT